MGNNFGLNLSVRGGSSSSAGAQSAQTAGTPAPADSTATQRVDARNVTFSNGKFIVPESGVKVGDTLEAQAECKPDLKNCSVKVLFSLYSEYDGKECNHKYLVDGKAEGKIAKAKLELKKDPDFEKDNGKKGSVKYFFKVQHNKNEVHESEKLEIKSIVDTLEDNLEKTIKDICTNEYIDNKHNHCAHFVSHFKKFTFGYTCKNQTGKGSGSGANIRVHEIFKKCPEIGKWNDKPADLKECLAFVTSSKQVNLTSKEMTNVPEKHIGIFKDEMIYHYSNSKDKVVKQTPAEFKNHYSGSDITVYYGKFPD